MTEQKPKVVAIIQARLSSSRLPGKVLQDISGQPMLWHVVSRVRRARLVDEVVVATTMDASDDPIEGFCLKNRIDFYRGSLFDVLDRYYECAVEYSADVVVRITGDCPVIDPDVVDLTVREFLERDVDFAANRLPPPWHRTYPIGLDTEVCSMAALQKAWGEAVEKHEREHVMPYLYSEEGRFKVYQVNTSPDYGDMRWTVDTPEDLVFIRRVFEALKGKDDFSWLDVLKLVQKKPELLELNAGIRHKVFDEVDHRNGGAKKN
jgi:spore coat polysaccharide biosynthesis protein SpsF